MPTGNAGSAGTADSGVGASHPSAAQASSCACCGVQPCDRVIAASTAGAPRSAGIPYISRRAPSAAARTLPGYLEVHQATTWLARSGGMTSKSPSSPAIGYLSDCRADRPGHLGLTEPGGDRHRGEIVEHWLVPGLQGPAGGPEQS